MDPQANSRPAGRESQHRRSLHGGRVVDGRATLDEIILPTETAGIDVAPAHIDLASTEGELFTALGREQILREAIRDHVEGYDYVLIDCPPNLGLLTVNGLVAADGVIIPVQTQYYAMKGLTNLVKVINAIRNKLNRELRILGLLPTFFDGRTNLARDMLDELRVVGDHHVFNSIIRNTVKLGEAPLVGRPITSYAPASEAARTYRALAREVIDLGQADFRAAAARRLSEDRELPPQSSASSPPRRGIARPVSSHPGRRWIESNPEQRDSPSTRRPCRSWPRASGSMASSSRSSSPPVDENRFQLIAGERRWRASLIAGLADTPPSSRTSTTTRRFDLDHREPPARGPVAARRGGDVRPDGPRARLQHPQARRQAGQGQGLLENRLRLADAPDEVRGAGVFAQGHPVPRLRADEGRGPKKKRTPLADQSPAGS
jgi:chromosome partitioning protein